MRRASSSLSALLLLAAVVALIAFRAIRLLNVPGDPANGAWALMDFRDAIYYPARALLDGVNPYDAAAYVGSYPVANALAPYLPPALLLGLPFAVFPYVPAEAAWFVAMIGLAIAFAAFALRLEGRRARPAAVLVVAALLLASRPGQMNALLGQATLVYVAGACAALGLAQRRPGLAAVGLAIATLKPTFGLPVALLLLARGERRVVAAGLALAVAASVAMLVRIATTGDARGLIDLATGSYAAFVARPMNSVGASLFRVDAAALAGRIFGGANGLLGELVFAAVILGVAAVTVARLRWSDRDERVLGTTIACVATLLCIYHQSYDLLLLAWPLVALTTRIGEVPSATSAVLLGLLAFPGLNYISTESVTAALGLEGSWWVAAASLNAGALASAFVVSVGAAWRAVSLRGPALHDHARAIMMNPTSDA